LVSLLQQTATVRFLQAYPTPQAAKAATKDELTAVLKFAGHKRAATLALCIHQKLHAPQLVANEITVRTKARLMEALVAQLLPLVEQIAVYDKDARQLF
jgi:hypothetical protein